MPTFRNVSEMKAYINERIPRALQQTEEVIKEVIDRFIKEYYGEWTPEWYDRTYQLYRSCVKSGVESAGSGFRIRVYLDANQLDYTMKSIKGRKISNVGGSEQKTLEAAAHGSHGGYRGGTAIWDEPNAILKKDVVNILKRMMIAAGLPVQ